MASSVRWVLAVMSTIIVTACQTEPDEPQGPYQAVFESNTIIPELAKWSSGVDSGVGTPRGSKSNRYQVDIPLASPPSKPVNVDLYRAGLQYYRLKFRLIREKCG